MDDLIRDRADLVALADEIRDATYAGIDTEFLRERTFHPRLCLLQIATPTRIACVDPLAVDVTPALEALEGHAIKIGHALRQDLEILHQLRGRLPTPVFDTQIAAALLGYDEQTGYAALVEAEIGIRLDKRHTRTDWAARPLSDEQLSYAANDVRHLAALRDRLSEHLSGLGRLSWVEEECQHLLAPQRYESGPETVAARFIHAYRLPPPSQQALAALVRWREAAARQADRPRQWIVDDGTLMRIAVRRPTRLTELRAIKGMSPKMLPFADDLLAAAATDGTQTGAVPWLPAKPLTDDQQRRLDILSSTVQRRARELGISAAVLGSRRELERVVRGHVSALLSGWRQTVLGAEIDPTS